VEDSALTNILLGYQGSTWKEHTKAYLLRRRRQSDDPESVVPSDFEIATFILVAATIDPYIPTVRPRAIKKHKSQLTVVPAAINRSRFDYI
jgi:5-enolpyruvylshikimate-3-phosphate synthase